MKKDYLKPTAEYLSFYTEEAITEDVPGIGGYVSVGDELPDGWE